jgi:phosphoribosylglycinamide formyltransferase 1
MMTKKRVAILISGRGSNMQALIEAATAADYPCEIVCVISNKPAALGLAYAHSHGITTCVIDHKLYESREAFDSALDDYLQAQNIDIVACAGFMRVMTPKLTKAWAGRMINIHPSLLPNYKGLHTHERVLADKVVSHGCTVHFVTADLDDGPIIAQSFVPVLKDDTLDSLSSRVLVEEHKLYPIALAKVALSKNI